METVLTIVAGILFAASLFMMLQRNLIKIALGLTILTNATNLFIFTLGRLTRSVPPLVPERDLPAPVNMANPVSEALILTAIVIGFGLLSFSLALIYRSYESFHSLNPNELELDHSLTRSSK